MGRYQYYSELFFWKGINHTFGTAYFTMACILIILGILLCIDYRIALKKQGSDRDEIVNRNKPIYIFWFVLLLATILSFVMFMVSNNQVINITTSEYLSQIKY